MLIKFFFPVFFGLLLSCLAVSGQNKLNLADPHEKAVTFYKDSVRENSSLYKGKVYVGVQEIIEGHPFFESAEWEIGTLFYRGKEYQNIPMLYDIFQDELIIKHLNGFLKIQTLKSGVALFSFTNKTFINIQKVSPADSSLPLGFYQKIHDGNLSLLIKRRKIINESIEGMEVRKVFEPTNSFYIQKDGDYILVNRKRSVLKVLKEHKSEIRKEMKAHDIIFRKDPEYAILRMVEFYEKEMERQ